MSIGADIVTRVSLVSCPLYLPRVRKIAACLAESVGMGQEEAAEAALVLNEACSNAIRHGSPRGEIDRVSITLKTSDRAIAADVTDSGRGIGRARCGSGRRKGLGMLLMHVLADSVELIKNSSGTTVRLVKQSKDTLGVHESESAGLRDVSRN